MSFATKGDGNINLDYDEENDLCDNPYIQKHNGDGQLMLKVLDIH